MSEAAPGLITVFGGSGFVGSQVVQDLARRGWRIRVAVRRPDRAYKLGKFTLICADGNLIMNASGESVPDFLRMAGLSLISLAEAAPERLR